VQQEDLGNRDKLEQSTGTSEGEASDNIGLILQERCGHFEGGLC
jgi:hypothetical protein